MRYSNFSSKYLTWKQIAAYCHCGRGKALRILHQQPNLVYIGRTPLVAEEDFLDFIQKCGGEIKVRW